ncbi:MAG: hypothetical protein IJS20_11610 [Bacteroidales bacterium]|nr:hypothetical protein [Bacteroidales bacterium]
MKKFLLTSCAILSAIGVQAQTTFTKDNVTYDAVLQSNERIQHRSDTVKELYAEDVRTTAKVLFSMDIHEISTYLYKYTATAKSIAANVASANIYSFKEYTAGNKSAYTGTLANPENYFVVGSTEYSEYFEDIDAETLTANNIKSYTDMAAETGVTGYYYWVWDENQEVWVATFTTNINDDNLSTSGYYQKYINSTTGKVFYYLIRLIGVARRYADTVHRFDSCKVTSIAQTIAMNTAIQTISLGKDITTIAAGAFLMDSKLSSFSVQDGGNFIYEDGILYNDTKRNIIAASKDVPSQTIPSSVNEIYNFAFFNTVNSITISSMNSGLVTNAGSQGSNVTFITPSANLTITADAENGGYIVTGNVTQSNFDAIAQTGTYFDFRGATIMENLSIDNQTNTIYYFATTANVSGNNVVNNGTCENFVLKDSYRTSKFYCPISFTATHASYDRVFDNCWSTMCIPFSVDGSVVNGNLYCGEFRTYNDAMALFSFLYSTSITANTPYIVRTVEDDQEFTITAENTTVYKTAEVEVIKGNACFINNFEPKVIYSNNDYNYFGVKKSTGASGNPTSNIVKLTGATVNSFRSYLKAPFAETNYDAAKIRLVDAMDNEIEEIELPYTTSIEKVENAECEEAIYDLNGQMQKEVKRGLNIVNGKVVLNK